MIYLFYFFLIAFFAAFIGGLVGIGGGLIALPIYLILFDNNFDQATLYSFIGMFFLTTVSVIKYSYQKTSPPIKKILPMVIGTSIGLYISMQFIQPWMNENNLENSLILNIILILILIIVSLLIIFQKFISVIHINEIYLLPISFIASIISSILGIGTSSIFLPVLLFLYGMNVKTIPVVTLLITGMVAICSILEKTIVLNIHLISPLIILPIAIGAILGAILGPLVNKLIKIKYILFLNVAVRILSIIAVLIPILV